MDRDCGPTDVTEETFALAAERLQANKDHAPRRTITPSVVQGLVSCRKCSYGHYRASTRTSARTIYDYVASAPTHGATWQAGV
jgi:site-specific DNA recombinase